MRTVAYFTEFILLPTIITGVGMYKTRGGEVVEILAYTPGNRYGCSGKYSCGTKESWHNTGRLYFGQTCDNDIIEKL